MPIQPKTRFRRARLLPFIVTVAYFAVPSQAQPPTPVPLQLTVLPRWESESPKIYCYASGSNVTVDIKAPSVAAAKNVQWVARDFDDNVLGQGRLTLDATGAGQMHLDKVEPGIVYVAVTLLGVDETVLAQKSTSFAVFRPRPVDAATNGAQLPVLYGISSHLHGLGEKDSEREIALMNVLGFSACRFDMSWVQVQLARGEWYWDVNDRIFSQFEKYKIVPAPVLGYTTRWASTGDQNSTDVRVWRNAPPVTADYVNFVTEAAKRYGRITPYWEVWNEPDIASWLGTAQQYATLFDAASDAIHATSPGALVMNGGFSETKRRPDFIPTWQQAVHTKPDIYSYHSHGPYANMQRAADDAARYRKASGWTMPLWLNEAGFSSAGNQTERDQAIILVKKMSAAADLGFSAYFWYDLRNDGTDPNENEHNFGLIRNDFTPKAATVAASTLMAQLKGQRFVRRISLSEVPQAYALQFESPDNSGGTLVLWNEVAGSVPIYWKTADATRISIMGTETPLKLINGLTVLAAETEPVFLKFRGPAERLEPLGSLLEFPSSLSIAPGQSAPLHLSLRNPLAQPLKGTLKLAASGGWRVDRDELPFMMASGGTSDWNLLATAPTSATGPQSLALTLSSAQLPPTADATARLNQALVIAKGTVADPLGEPAKWGQPVTHLSAINRVSLFEATPMQELHLKGEDDLSADVFMKRVPQGLNLAVRVRDDVFAQTEAVNEEWRGDSIQWALALPSGEHYEWYAALSKNGPVASLGIAPRGVKTGRIELPMSIRREGNETFYEVIVPEILPGGAKLPDRFSFSLLVNDNDGTGRKGWVEWTPGIGRTKDPRQFQSVVVE